MKQITQFKYFRCKIHDYQILKPFLNTFKINEFKRWVNLVKR